jgi:hypothetical protein
VPLPVGAAAAPLFGAGALNSVRMSKLCPSAGTAQAVAAKATAPRNPIDEVNVAMAVHLGSTAPVRLIGNEKIVADCLTGGMFVSLGLLPAQWR